MMEGRDQQAEKLLTAVNAAAGAVSKRFVTFVSVGAYVAVTVASTTHEMLLRAKNLVTLPLLNAQIPIIGSFGFYTIAPWLILLLHADLLLQLSALDDELGRLDKEVEKSSEHHRALLRQRVANFYYVLYLTGQAPSRFLHLLSAFITWLTAVVLPLGLLLYIQIRFLPFHSPTATWMHRTALLIDVALILLNFLPRVRTRPPPEAARPSRWLAVARRVFSLRILVVLAAVAAGWLSLFVATVPKDRQPGVEWFARNLDLRERVLTETALSPQDINALRDYETLEQLRQVLDKVSPFYALKGRDLRYADLFNATLPRLDLRAAQDSTVSPDWQPPPSCQEQRGCEDPPECEDPRTTRTLLNGVNFQWASMQRVMLDDAVLEEADLSWARLQEASLSRARLNGAALESARMECARLDSAKLCGADLSGAQLMQANLTVAHLQGADLRGARLDGAHLQGADLRAADLSGANLKGANLREAQLQGALLRGAVTDGADLEGANTELTDMSAGAASESKARKQQVNDFLVELACRNPHVARGLSRQALESAERGRGLTSAILKAQSRPDCPGIVSLPAQVRTQLQESVKPKKAKR